MKILGIGNAIVDVICKVDDSFIDKNKIFELLNYLYEIEECK